jgi:hypothetical protein
MILDAHNQFSDSQAVTTPADSTNVIDLGSTGQDIGVGEDLYLVVSVATALTGAAVTTTVTLITDDNAAMTSDVTVATLGVFAAAAAAGSRLIIKLPPSSLYERFIAVHYETSGAGLTGGAFDAFLTKDIHAFTAYPDNITIS